MEIAFFGKLAELAGTRGATHNLPAHITSGNELRDWLAQAYQKKSPRLVDALFEPGTRLVVGDEIVEWEAARLVGAKQVAVIPVLSGG